MITIKTTKRIQKNRLEINKEAYLNKKKTKRENKGIIGIV